LATNIEIVRHVCDKLSSVSRITSKLINDKFKNVLDKNKGFEVLQDVSNILSGDEIGANKLPKDFNIHSRINIF
jgi:hypothetical protein